MEIASPEITSLGCLHKQQYVTNYVQPAVPAKLLTMYSRHVCIGLSLVCLFAGCTYDSVRMNERQRCGRMLQTQAERCYARTKDTKAEFEAKRRELKQSLDQPQDKPTDSRYKEWIP